MHKIHSPYSGIPGIPGNLPPNHSSDSPDQFWFDPSANQIVISKTSPTNDSILVIANAGGGNPNLRDIYEQFVFQQRDAFNSNYRKDAGTYDTKAKREERQRFYNNQRPQDKLGKKHSNVSFENDRDPNPSGYLGGQSVFLKRQFWMKIVTPDRFTYTTVIIANVPKEGVLHLLLRHGHQFRSLRRDILQILPSQNLKQLCRTIRDFSPRPGMDQKEVSREKERQNNAFMNEMMKLNEDEFNELLGLQREMRDVIQNIVKQENYLGESININGQQQVYWKSGQYEVMVICLSEQLYEGEVDGDDRGRKRPIRKIITIFITSNQDFERKKNNDWPVTKIFS